MYERIKQLCKKRGITVTELENALDTVRSIHRWDTNRPSIDKVKAVADYFGVTVDYLLGGDMENATDRVKQELFDTPGKRILFSAMDGATENDLILAAQVIEALKGAKGK